MVHSRVQAHPNRLRSATFPALLLLPQSYHRRFSPPRHGAIRYLGHAHDTAVQPHPQGDVLGPAQYRHASGVRRLDLARSLSNPTYAESRAASVIDRTF